MQTALLIIDIQNDYFPGGKTVTAEQVHLSFLAALQAAYAQVLPADEILRIIQAE